MKLYSPALCICCLLLCTPVAQATSRLYVPVPPVSRDSDTQSAVVTQPSGPSPQLAAALKRPPDPGRRTVRRSPITLYVNTAGYVDLNLRAQPTTQSQVVLTAPYRARLRATAPPVRGADGRDWYRVRYQGTVAYALGSLLSRQVPEKIFAKPVPDNWLLGPMTHDYQRLNNCAPTATMMALSYFGWQHTQADVAYALRPSALDVSVTAAEVVRYVQEHGLHAVVRVGGTPGLMRRLVANNVPIIGLHLLNTWEDIGHFSVLRGYDRASDTFILNDSNNGPMQYVPVAQYMELWEPYERAYIAVYRPWQEPVVRAILGEDWDATANARRYARDQVAIAEAEPSATAWMSAGYGLYLLGEYEDAVQAYREAQRYGLSRRVLWYASWPAAALNQLGKHTEALLLANAALVQTPASSEMLLERGNALLGLGRQSDAIQDYALAVEYAPYLISAREALSRAR